MCACRARRRGNGSLTTGCVFLARTSERGDGDGSCRERTRHHRTSACMSTYMFTRMSMNLSARVFTHMSIRVSTHMPTHMPVHMSTHRSIQTSTHRPPLMQHRWHLRRRSRSFHRTFRRTFRGMSNRIPKSRRRRRGSFRRCAGLVCLSVRSRTETSVGSH